MYSLRCANFMFARRCPLTQMASVSKYSYSNFMKKSTTGVTSLLTDKFQDQEEILKRNYVSVGDKKFKDFDLRNINFTSVINQSKQIIKEVKLSELANAPQPAFWYSAGGLVPFIFPTVSCMLFGYSPFLVGAQLTYGATICSFLGGLKWGQAMNDKSRMTWESLGLSVAPQLVAWVGLLMPQTLGIVMVCGGLLGTAFIDLTTVTYPAWFKALRLSLTIPAVASLLLTAIMCLFH